MIQYSKIAFKLFLFSLLMPLAPAMGFETLPQLEAHFRPFNTGWIGADGIYSVALPNKTLWLFGDTLMGSMHTEQREVTGMWRNTVAIEKNKRWHFTPPEGPPLDRTFFELSDPEYWFWPGPGLYHNGQMHFMLPQFVHDKGDAAFAFKQSASYFAQVSHPDRPLSEWRINYTRLPWQTAYTVAAVADHSYWYLYGYKDLQHGSQTVRQAHLMRWPLKQLAGSPASTQALIDSAQFWDGRGWSSEPENSFPLFSGFQSEASVHFHAPSQEYLMVYTDNDFSGNVVLRKAKSPAGPWSQAQVLFRTPEHGNNGAFCYAAKAHPHLADFLPQSFTPAKSLVIGYACNAFEPKQLELQPQLYLPRFVAVNLPD